MGFIRVPCQIYTHLCRWESALVTTGFSSRAQCKSTAAQAHHSLLPHETSRTYSRPRGYPGNAHSVNITFPPSIRHLTPSMPYSQYASVSRVSMGTCHSFTRPITGSESRQAVYLTHVGPVHSCSISVHNSIAAVHHGSSILAIDSVAKRGRNAIQMTNYISLVANMDCQLADCVARPF